MSGAGGRALLAGYRLGGLALRPLVPLLLAERVRRGKENRARTGERYGVASLPRPAGRLIWVHAASVGETNAVLPLVDRLTEAGFKVLFTSTTLTSAEIAARRLPPGAVHQFGPIDIDSYVRRFLAHWRPELAIFAESELWPNVMRRLADAAIPLVVVNARLSERSFGGWKRYGATARAVFSGITLCLAQSEDDARRFAALGAPDVRQLGNLKFDVPALTADRDELAALKATLGGRPVWVAASTHEGEEEIVAAAHRVLKARFADLLTVIVPRHPNRGGAVRQLLVAAGLGVAQRSRGEPLDRATEVYLADTLNELGLFFRLAPIAFLGGSLTPQGGHNPIEPLRLGVAVVHGPHVHNFADLFHLLDAAAPLPPVTDAASLAAVIGDLIAAPARATAVAGQAAAALAPLSGALDATLTALAPLLEDRRQSDATIDA